MEVGICIEVVSRNQNTFRRCAKKQLGDNKIYSNAVKEEVNLLKLLSTLIDMLRSDSRESSRKSLALFYLFYSLFVADAGLSGKALDPESIVVVPAEVEVPEDANSVKEVDLVYDSIVEYMAKEFIQTEEEDVKEILEEVKNLLRDAKFKLILWKK